MKTLALTLLFTLSLGLGFSAPSHAERADRDAPTKVDSDRLDHDDQRLVTVFTGRVTLTKGTLKITGDRMELQQLPNGESLAVVTGKPAKFHQKREGVNEWMFGESTRIDYDSRTEIAIFTGQADMRRLAGEKLMDHVSGDHLTYNNVDETYKVTVVPGQSRARMTLMPRESTTKK
ncbi:MAG: lipopolysaccharide transport periplasmic protein LptA [Betaproteobacteria bacterium]|nr:lipopolysaccharide transport periplasmic protein LptA [Betaproteobacteria bacterium]NBT75057.1 lipopolysaccharide transport periplasmic protein LptA [Betaproteobacteria bacterium]NBY13339.1 lipopolysaccharide transport periplasmic protein LptA [Betaproteobacteria bacterium]NCA16612.1 lipopolysaccharide transport periplasmic protein LptA [Betaproteobacteria bacterium]